MHFAIRDWMEELLQLVDVISGEEMSLTIKLSSSRAEASMESLQARRV